MLEWYDIENNSDLDKLPKNSLDTSKSYCVLVYYDLEGWETVYLMYFNYEDWLFHFPAYSVEWKRDPTLKPIIEVKKWANIPRPEDTGKGNLYKGINNG